VYNRRSRRRHDFREVWTNENRSWLTMSVARNTTRGVIRNRNVAIRNRNGAIRNTTRGVIRNRNGAIRNTTRGVNRSLRIVDEIYPDR
jgi:hypothetical protein